MKRCPECRRDYYDDTLFYCLDDGNVLLEGPRSADTRVRSSFDEPATAILSGHGVPPPGGPGSEPEAIATGFPASESPTRAHINTTDQTAIFPRGAEAEPQEGLGGLTEKQSFSANRAAKPQWKVGGRQWQLAGFAIAILILVGGFFGYRYFSPAKQIESIAVMPFVNESGNADVEYLSDGMTETLISSLSQLPNMDVRARSSVFRYKGKDTDARTIAKELDVQAILTGKVVQREKDLSLYVELVDAASDKVIWSETYNRPMTNLVVLQKDIARDVSRNLQTKLSGADEQKLAKNYTENTEAYKLYLRGRFHWNKRTGEEVKKSVEHFQQAIELDPSYALAFAGLADAYSVIPSYASGSPKEFFPKSKAAAKRALELDESLAEAHTALARVLFAYEWNFAESDKEYQRAIELNPNYPTAHHWYGNANLLRTGRFDESIAEMKRAQELDPLSLIINADLGENYVLARRYDEGIDQLQKTIEMDPRFYYSYRWLGIAYQLKGNYPAAMAEYSRARQSDDDPWILRLLGQGHAASGNKVEALKSLAQLKEVSREKYVPPYHFAVLYTSLGDKDQAFEWLEKSYLDRGQEMTRLKIDPFLDPLRDDPRFKDLLKRVGLPE